MNDVPEIGQTSKMTSASGDYKSKDKSIISNQFSKERAPVPAHKTFSANFGHGLENLPRKKSATKKQRHSCKNKNVEKYHKLKRLCKEYDHKVSL